MIIDIEARCINILNFTTVLLRCIAYLIQIFLQKARFILPANAIRMLTSHIRNEKFAAVQLCSTHLRISLRKEGCDIKFTSNLLHRKYEPCFMCTVTQSWVHFLLQQTRYHLPTLVRFPILLPLEKSDFSFYIKKLENSIRAYTVIIIIIIIIIIIKTSFYIALFTPGGQP